MQYKKQLLAIITKYLSNGNVYLFGSRARKTHTRASDIDIALDIGQPIDSSVLSNIKEAIEESEIPLFVDVLDFQILGSDLQKIIKKEGVAWTI